VRRVELRSREFNCHGVGKGLAGSKDTIQFVGREERPLSVPIPVPVRAKREVDASEGWSSSV
jgi:hypothetical protein